MHSLVLQAGEKRFRQRIIPTLTGPPDRMPQPSRVSVARYSADVYCVPRSELNRIRFNADRGSTYTANSFTTLCRDRLGVVQSMGRVGSCFDNAAAEAFFSSLEHEVLSRHHFRPWAEARAVVVPGARSSTTSNDGTGRRRCCRRTSTRESLPSSRTQLKQSLHDSGETQVNTPTATPSSPTSTTKPPTIWPPATP